MVVAEIAETDISKTELMKPTICMTRCANSSSILQRLAAQILSVASSSSLVLPAQMGCVIHQHAVGLPRGYLPVGLAQ